MDKIKQYIERNSDREFPNMRLYKQLLLVVAIVMLDGCGSIGPGRVGMDRGLYNWVVRDTEQEEILSNIVRGRFLESAQFMQITGVTASYQLGESLQGGYAANYPHGPTTYGVTLTPNVNYSDSPTISYIPLSNSDFATSLMTPVSMLNFLLLIHAGAFDQIALFEVFFEQLNNIDSSMQNRNGWNYTTQEQLQVFEIMHLLKKLQARQSFDVPRSVLYQKHLGIMLRFKLNQENSADARKLKKLLGVHPNSRGIVFLEHSFDEDLHVHNGLLALDEAPPVLGNTVYVRLRSVYGAIKYLGFGVHVPDADRRAHITRELIKPDGTIFDWSHKMSGVFNVYSSRAKPRTGVFAKTKLDRYWYYIQASDLASKDMLVAIQRLYTLSSVTASPTNSLPVITIPVGGGSVTPR